LPEVDPATTQTLREAFLLQRYGGPVVEPEPDAGVGDEDERSPVGDAAPAADYSVEAWVDARTAFRVIDNWCAARQEAASDAFQRERVRLDGEGLRTYYARGKKPADALAAEELGWHLDEQA
jgi:predicted kinase